MKQPSIQYDKDTQRYFARVQVDGVRRRFWLGKTKRDAEGKLRDTIKDIAAGKIAFTQTESTVIATPEGGKSMRLEELAHLHLEWVSTNRSQQTYMVRKYGIKAFLQFMGECMVTDITRLKLSQYHQWARENHGRGANGGNHHLCEVRAMLRWAEEYEVCDNPVKRMPPMRNMPPRTLRFTDDEIHQLLGGMPAGDFRDMLVFGLVTGLRPPELRGLKRSEVCQAPDGKSYVLIEQHKTSKSAKNPLPRTVPLPVEAVAIVRRQMNRHPKTEYIFLTEDGTPYSADVYRRKLERWCKRLKIASKPPYALRHTFASLQADAGTNIVSLSQLMGHTDSKTTSRYIRSTFEHHRQVVDRTAEHILSLMVPTVAAPETGEKVASKVASNPPAQNETGGTVDGTACTATA